MIEVGLSALGIVEAISKGETTAVDVLSLHLEKIEQDNVKINAFTKIHYERAYSQARKVDRIHANGQSLPLAGVPFAVKNLFDICDQKTYAGSKINESLAPSKKDAVLITRLEQAGAVLVGSLNMGEYAYDFTGENAHFGACRNPWDLDRMAGGSSSGSAAALSAGCVPLTLGTDTNGSIRVPSAFCGVWGLKPTYGRLPRSGTFPFCNSLDHVGPMARSVADLHRAYTTIQGYHEGDAACIANIPPRKEPNFPLRIGLATGYFADGVFSDTEGLAQHCCNALLERGHSVVEIDLPNMEEVRAAAFLITNIESGQLHRERLLRQPEDFDPETRDRFLAGNLLPAAWYIRAQRARNHFAKASAVAMADVDCLIAPATPSFAPLLGQKTFKIFERDVPLRPNLGYFTQPISCIGLPVISAPLLAQSTLPLGVQLIGHSWGEDACFMVAAELEQIGICQSKVAKNFL